MTEIECLLLFMALVINLIERASAACIKVAFDLISLDRHDGCEGTIDVHTKLTNVF